jgi:hypothetical protein
MIVDVGQGSVRQCAVPSLGCADQWRKPMCDYSLHAVASRPAKVGETLVTSSFYGTSTRGFAAKQEPGVAVCLLPGTELAFEHDVRYNRFWLSTKDAGFRVAQFCQIAPRASEQHRDALAFPDGNTVLVNLLSEGQHARVVQLPVTRQEHSAQEHSVKEHSVSAEKASTTAAELEMTP